MEGRIEQLKARVTDRKTKSLIAIDHTYRINEIMLIIDDVSKDGKTSVFIPHKGISTTTTEPAIKAFEKDFIVASKWVEDYNSATVAIQGYYISW